jgi:hypothetical protein
MEEKHDAVNYSTVRENLKTYCDKAVDDLKPSSSRARTTECCSYVDRRINNLLENLKIVGDRNTTKS